MPKLRDQFEKFFNRQETFSLGICNGCQMLSQLAPLIPGAEAWPRFHRNTSEVFEARSSERSCGKIEFSIVTRHARFDSANRSGTW